MTNSEATPYTLVDLNLDVDDDINISDDDDERFKRRCLLKIPTTNEILAYGGTNNSIQKLITTSNSLLTTKFHTNDVRHWEDQFIRTLAISIDGKRVAVGNDISETKIFTYESYDPSSKDKESIHPFCQKNNSSEIFELGPTFDAPIRDMQFYPNNSDWLAIATEGGMGIVCLKQTSKYHSIKYLWDEVEEQHDGSGIRSMAFHQLKDNVVVLASLAMDGRLCLWDVSDINQPDNWKILVREANKCITKNDTGEMLGADAWDQSCRPLFLTVPSKMNTSERVSVLALPGMPYLQLRRLDYDNGKVKMEMFDQPNIENTVIEGHIEPIVALATCKNSSYLISTGRDKRVVVWSIQQRKVRKGIQFS